MGNEDLKNELSRLITCCFTANESQVNEIWIPMGHVGHGEWAPWLK